MKYIKSSSALIGKRIRSERTKRGMTQSQLSARLRISVSYLGALERGTRAVSRSMMDRLHEELGLSYDYIIEGPKGEPSLSRSLVCEPEFYRMRRSTQYLLSSCTSEEINQCFRLINTYLDCLHSRATESDLKPSLPHSAQPQQ